MTTDLTCHMRSLGHVWESFEPMSQMKTLFGIPDHFRCVNCGTVKYEIISRFTGERLARTRYIHPTTYARGADVPGPDALRKEYVNLLDKQRKARKSQ